MPYVNVTQRPIPKSKQNCFQSDKKRQLQGCRRRGPCGSPLLPAGPELVWEHGGAFPDAGIMLPAFFC